MTDHAPDAGATRRHGRALLAVVCAIVVGLVLTTFATWWTYERERDAAAVQTSNRMMEIGAALDRQLTGYAEVLYGLRAGFALDPTLSRKEFRELVDIRALTQRNPGAASVAFDRKVAGREGTRVIVDYLEPHDPGSPALGLDITTDPVRRDAVLFARDSGELSATQPLSLVLAPPGRGFLMMLAAYDVSPVPLTGPARIRHFLGVVVVVFTTEDLVAQAMGFEPALDVSIYDAGPTVETPRATPRPDDWLAGDAIADYTNYADIDVGSRRWRLVTDDPVPARTAPSVAIAVSGTALTLLIVGVLTALSLSRRRAVTLAELMIQDVRMTDERLREANETLRGFVGVAAHDLRSPLIAIAGFSSLLADDHGDVSPDHQRLAAAAIARQAGHMSRLVDDLLTLSAIDEDGLAPRRLEPVLVSAAIKDCLEGTEAADLVTVKCPVDLFATADPHDLRRMLDNYVRNALKYGDQPIRIEATRAEGWVEIRVVDYGPGVPPEFVPRLFSKFARADSPQTRTQPGTGLGLYIVRGLAQANGGTASYARNFPRGACFSIKLPTAGPSATSHEQVMRATRGRPSE